MSQGKRQQFLEEQNRYKGPNRVVIFAFVLVAVVGIGIFALVNSDNTSVPKRWEGGNYNVGYVPDYKNKVISMTDVGNEVVDGQILLNLEDVKKYSIIYTEYERGADNNLALTAFISPAGRLVAAVAMCEPCRSERFHINENILVCDTCGTRWLLSDLKGLSGGCPEYPPEELPYEVKDGKISIDTALIKDWQPRI